MGDYDTGSTGVGKLHISFAKREDLVTLSNVEMPQLGHKYQPVHREKSKSRKYADFKYQMDKQLKGRKRVNSNDFNKCLTTASRALGTKVITLKSPFYKGHYLKDSGITIVSFYDERHRKYLKDYAVFKSERDKYPNAYGKERANLRKRVSDKTGVSEKTLSGLMYEYKWQAEYDNK